MNRHPAVWIFRSPFVAEEAYQPILWGLEEEGIPFEVRDASDGAARDLAGQAANGSPLDVGIAIGKSGDVVLHHRDLPVETPLFSISIKSQQPGTLRRLGMNAARLVKRQPLTLGYDPLVAAESQHSPGNPSKHLEDLIIAILGEIFADPSFLVTNSS